MFDNIVELMRKTEKEFAYCKIRTENDSVMSTKTTDLVCVLTVDSYRSTYRTKQWFVTIVDLSQATKLKC